MRIRKKANQIRRYNSLVFILLATATISGLSDAFAVVLHKYNHCPMFVIVAATVIFVVSSLVAFILSKLADKNIYNLIQTQREISLRDKECKEISDLYNIENVIFIQDLIVDNRVTVYAIIDNGGTVKEYAFSKEKAGEIFKLREF